MTANEFVFWLSGYVTAINERVKVPNDQDWAKIKEALSKVSMGVHAVHLQTFE